MNKLANKIVYTPRSQVKQSEINGPEQVLQLKKLIYFHKYYYLLRMTYITCINTISI